MISTNGLSVFILHNHLNGLSNKNLRSIQYVMRASEPVTKNYKRACKNFPNLTILTNSATTGKIQLTFGHADVENKYLGESVVDFALAGDRSSTSFISLNIDIAFAADGDKICLLIAEVLLRAATGNLAYSKKQRDWNLPNTVFLPQFITE